MEKLLIHRSNNVVHTSTENVALKKHLLKPFISSSDVEQERIHVENIHLDGRGQKGKLIINYVYQI